MLFRVTLIALHLFLLTAACSGQHAFVAVHTGTPHPRLRRDVSTQIQGPQVKKLLVDSVIRYRYANTVIFSKLANPANVSQEVSFTTVLPDSAFISGFAITLNDQVYKAYVKEKEEARNIYQDAVRRGQTAGHVELSARDSKTFTVSVNVEAQGKVNFNLTHEELLTRELGTYKHKINLNPKQIVKDLVVQVTIEESSNITNLHVPDLQENNDITVQSTLDNSLAEIERPNGTMAVIRWAPTAAQQREINSGGVKGMLEVRYDVDRTTSSNQILMNEGYFVHFFAPENLNPLAKHVVFVLDVSGSMHGRKIEQLKLAMRSILEELRPADAFSIILFSSSHRVWKTNGQLVNARNHGEPLSAQVIAEATADNIQAAKRTVDEITAGGGTHMYDALQIGLEVVHFSQTLNNNSAVREPMIIFLTDGDANGPNSDSQTIINHTTSNNTNPSAVIYSLGFGRDANMDLMKKLSLKNSGFARKIYEAADATIQLQNFYRQVSSPLLSNVSFHYVEDQVDLSSVTRLQFWAHNNGSELVVAGRLNNVEYVTGDVSGHADSGDIVLTSEPGLQVFDYYPRPPLVENATSASFMERLWAYLTIRQLLDLKESTSNDTIKTQALEIALNYSFVTPLTSLVVVKPNETISSDLETAAADAPDEVDSRSGGISRRKYHQSVPNLSSGQRRTVNAAFDSVDRTGFRTPRRRLNPSGSDFTARGSMSRAPKRTGGARTTTLSSMSWFPAVSNQSHITLTVNGTAETLQLGYSEANNPFNACSSPLSIPSHCRHLPHCALRNFAQDINVFMQYFCRIDTFVGACCPDNLQTQTSTSHSRNIL